MDAIKRQPTHHVLFGDDIINVSQGWRYVTLIKVGRKWIYFKLFEGSEQQYKTKLAKWETLTKKVLNEQSTETVNETDIELEEATGSNSGTEEGSSEASQKRKRNNKRSKKMVSASLRPKRKKRSGGSNK